MQYFKLFLQSLSRCVLKLYFKAMIPLLDLISQSMAKANKEPGTVNFFICKVSKVVLARCKNVMRAESRFHTKILSVVTRGCRYKPREGKKMFLHNLHQVAAEAAATVF